MAMLVVRMDGWGVIPQTNSSSWPLPKDCNLKRGKLQVKTAPATGGMSSPTWGKGLVLGILCSYKVNIYRYKYNQTHIHTYRIVYMHL